MHHVNVGFQFYFYPMFLVSSNPTSIVAGVKFITTISKSTIANLQALVYCILSFEPGIVCGLCTFWYILVWYFGVFCRNIISYDAGEGGEITVGHLLLGIWAQKDSAGHKVLAALGFNDEKAKEVATFVSLEFSCLHLWYWRKQIPPPLRSFFLMIYISNKNDYMKFKFCIWGDGFVYFENAIEFCRLFSYSCLEKIVLGFKKRRYHIMPAKLRETFV